MGAKLKYEINDNKKFVNPYTFLPIEKAKCQRTNGEEVHSELHTGYLECKLITKTPLAIPDTEKREHDPTVKDHYRYPFYSVNGELMVPGSSIRGVIRSIYETATGSCMATLRDNIGLSKRTDNRHAFKAGLLIKEVSGWKLYSADKYLIPCKRYTPLHELNEHDKTATDERIFRVISRNGERKIECENRIISNGDKISFTEYGFTHQKNRFDVWKGIVSTLDSTSPLTGYVFIGENFGKKHGEEVFVKKNAVPFAAGKIVEMMNLLEESLKIYRNPSINKDYGGNHSGYSGYESAKEAGIIPVWYNNDGQLSAASIGRVFHKNTLNDLVGEKDRCKDRTAVCKACSLFGMIGKKSLGSKIRITDARPLDEIRDKKYCSLKELGMPRYSYLPFYSKEGLDYDDEHAQIRGRKYYWHDLNVNKEESYKEEGEKTNRNSTMELVGQGNTFSFKIFYDSITEEQLKELMWCITFGENKEDSNLCHKLGHGKPLGLGSVKIVVGSVVERAADDYKITTDKPGEEIDSPFSLSKSISRLKLVANVNSVKGKTISYPYIDTSEVRNPDGLRDNDTANHRWFSRNSNSKDKKQYLPVIMDKKGNLMGQELCAISIKTDNQ